jgi:hypothetical protein
MPALRLIAVLVGIFSLTATIPHCASPDDATPTEPTAEQLQFFEEQVRPLLADRCQSCHGEEKQSGNLRLDHIGTILGGGDSGPAIVPGDPETSLLVEAIRYQSFEMPPDGQLAENEIAILVDWIAMGAPWPGADRTAIQRTPDAAISDEDRAFWSFQPVADPAVPVVQNEAWCRNEIDHFILATQESVGLSPAPEADKRTLIRRLTYDLTGLPPTPEEVEAFVNDSSPQAYDQLIARLLSSPRYGEHWAHYWLDLVRYAESDGYKQDAYRENAWRYRDYVIRSLNDDKPYDQFVREQLAGDEIAPADPEARIATAYFRHGLYEYNQRDVRGQWRDILNDVTDTTGDVFLGLGMGCARCHDHKFDPILQRDYFRLQAFFANISFRDREPLATPDEVAEFNQRQSEWETATADIRRQIDELEAPLLAELEESAIVKFAPDLQEIWHKLAESRTPLEQQIAHLLYLQVLEEHNKVATKFNEEQKAQWESLRSELAEFDHLKPDPLPIGPTIADVGTDASPVFIPGKERLGEIVPGFLTIFEPEAASILPPDSALESTGRRSALANWLTRPDHPLTSRVIVNRVWQQHFGVGLVATPSDFGHLGEAPSHPELLDWLARRFVEHGWSLKWLHHEIVSSATWRQSSLVEASHEAEAIDVANRLLWRQNIRRLDAEQIRDSMLSVSGELQLQAEGPSASPAESSVRSIYARILRNAPDRFLESFDMPARISSVGGRNVTTTTAQSLIMINGDWTLARADAFADRLLDEVPGSDQSLVERAWQLVYHRPPTDDEKSSALAFLDACRERAPADSDDAATSLIDFCHVLLNSNEFLYVD